MFVQNFEQVFLDKEKSSIVDHNQAFFGQKGIGKNMQEGRGKGHGRGPNTSQRNPSHYNINNYYSGNTTASHSMAPPKINKNWKALANNQQNQSKEGCQICNKTNHTVVSCYYGYDYATDEENAQC
ncbi:hypothetical protein LguiA_007516 [Lonicera macranthoides]